MSAKESLKMAGARFALPEAQSWWRFEVRPGGWVVASRVRPNGTVERRRLALWESRGKLGFSAEGALGFAEVLSDRRSHAGEAHGADSDLAAQFPGKVRKLLVREGQTVAQGEPLLLVEAMKMEFAIKAPWAGQVTRVRVTEGQQLMPGDRFLDLEAPANGAGSNGA